MKYGQTDRDKGLDRQAERKGYILNTERKRENRNGMQKE